MVEIEDTRPPLAETPETHPKHKGGEFRVAVIGSGPAGFYTAGHLLRIPGERFAVDIIERLPTPWGLVRSGVAPDRPQIKSVARVYERTADHPRFRYFGNVELGRDVSRDELLANYDAVVYATGAEDNRVLGVPGEDTHGVHAATEFVGWYNGHPDYRELKFDLLSAERAVVLGNGNVALDVARILVSSPEELARTDVAEHALEVFRQSRVSEVVIIGRRGPSEAAFTAPELLELRKLKDIDVVVDSAEIASALVNEHDPRKRQNLEILHNYAETGTRGARKRIVFRFLLSPTAFLSERGRLSAVKLAHNSLTLSGGESQAATTGTREIVSTSLAFRAIGSRGVALPGVPFEPVTATIPNRAGRVIDPASGQTLSREYVAGWAKYGPSGVIGTSKRDAQETVDCIATDFPANSAPPDGARRDETEQLLRSRQPELVDYTDWEAIDLHERKNGELTKRPRVKLTRVDEMLRVARSATTKQ